MIDTQPKLKQFNIFSEMLMQLFSIQRNIVKHRHLFFFQRKNIEKKLQNYLVNSEKGSIFASELNKIKQEV